MDFIKEIYKIWIAERPTQLAAALAYFGLFSFAPVIYISFIVAGIFIDRSALLERVMSRIEVSLGPGISRIIQNMLDNLAAKSSGGSILISLISFIALLLAASGIFYQLQFALNTVWKVPIPTNRLILGLIRKQLFSFVMVISLGLVLVATAVLSFFANWLSSIFTFFGFRPWLTIISFFAVAVLAFAVMYKILPEVRIAWRDVWAGAIAAAALITIGLWLISFILKNTSFASALETTGSFIILITGFYYFSQIFLLGAIISRVYAHRYGSMREPVADQVAMSQPLERQ